MDAQKDKNTVVVGEVVSMATTQFDAIRQFPATRLTAEDVAPFRLTADEVSRILQKQG